MTPMKLPPHLSEDLISRPLILALIRTALASNEIRFARESAIHWLSEFPGDLEVRRLLAQAISQIRGPSHALPILEELSEIDPQWLELQQSIYAFRKELNLSTAGDAGACVLALGGRLDQSASIPEWGTLLTKARLALIELKLDQAEIYVQRALIADPPTPLPPDTIILASARFIPLSF